MKTSQRPVYVQLAVLAVLPNYSYNAWQSDFSSFPPESMNMETQAAALRSSERESHD